MNVLFHITYSVMQRGRADQIKQVLQSMLKFRVLLGLLDDPVLSEAVHFIENIGGRSQKGIQHMKHAEISTRSVRFFK